MKRSKNQIRREKAKQRKVQENNVSKVKENPKSQQEQAVGEPVELHIDESSDLFKQYQSVFNKFQPQHEEPKQQPKENKVSLIQNSDSESSESEEEQTVSKRQLRLQNKIPLSSLKLSIKNPELVEWSDADAKDPFLLVAIKSQPNVIQVPSHWNSKKDYLSSRKGFERLPFQLPKFIKDTGIEEMRQVNDKTLKQQQREKVQVKLGKLDIDYEKLYNAFFKNQTKPRLFQFGELYEEGKENVDQLNKEVAKIRPGVLSSRLRSALGMSEHDQSIPPAWITIMKEIGKPPTYANLTIPGLDSEYRNTGYSDKYEDENYDTVHFGKLNNIQESEEEEDEDEDEDEEEEEEEEMDKEEEEEKEEEKERQEAQKYNDEEHYQEEEENIKTKEPTHEKTTMEILSELEPKTLYKVVKETKTEDDSLTGHTYESNFKF